MRANEQTTEATDQIFPNELSRRQSDQYCSASAGKQFGNCGGRLSLTVRMRWLESVEVSIGSLEERGMSWKTPKIIEIALGAEINSYACAKLS